MKTKMNEMEISRIWKIEDKLSFIPRRDQFEHEASLSVDVHREQCY